MSSERPDDDGAAAASAPETSRLLHGVRVGRIAGVEVRVDWSVLVIAWLLVWSLAGDALPSAAPGQPTWAYWTVGAVAAVMFLVSLLAHELSHSVVAQRHGVPVHDITLWMLGGMSALESEPRDAGTELRIAVAGPAMSLAIALGAFGAGMIVDALGTPRVIAVALWWLATINAILAVFNLVPAAPLDGGRVLTAVLWGRRGDHTGALISAARAGVVFAYVLIGLGLIEFAFGDLVGGVWLAFLGWFVLSIAHAEERAARTRRELERAAAAPGRVHAPPGPAAPLSRHRSFRGQ